MQLINAISNNRTLNKHGVKITWALAIVCLMAMLLHIGLTLRTHYIVKTQNYQPQTVRPISKNNQHLYRVRDIVSANLFGDPTPVKVVKKAPKTTLDLTLQGVLWATDTNMARAIIMTGKKASKLYSVGESIDGAGASVKEIKDGEVLLNRNGATERLPLNKKTDGSRQLITYTDVNPSNDFYDPNTEALDVDEADFDQARFEAPQQNIQRSSPRPRSEYGEPRKIRRPNFSGLDRALRKMEEL